MSITTCRFVNLLDWETAELSAKIMLDNSVSGADLSLYSEPESLRADLRMTPFAARKALQVRDLHLGRA